MGWPGLVIAAYVGIFIGMGIANAVPQLATSDLKETALFLAGMIGIPLLIWRTIATDRSARASLTSANAALRNAEVALKQATETESKNRFEQLFSAFEQLGSNVVHVRVGAIHMLGSMAAARVDQRAIIVETLTSFLQGQLRLPFNEKDRKQFFETLKYRHIKEAPARFPDNAAALKVLGRCRQRGESDGQTINLALLDLEGADFSGANLQGASFFRSLIANANFGGADLTCANLAKSIGPGAKMTGAILNGADISGADLRGARLTKAIDLTEAQLQTALISPESHENETAQRPAT